MPSSYTHYYIGYRILQNLPEEMRREIEGDKNALDCFSLGLHGPDSLFFYRPLKKTAVRKLGSDLHAAPALPFFEEAKEIYKARGNRLCDRAFLYGFLCHFALDAACHPRIAQKTAEGEVVHSAVESSLDKIYLLQNGKDPLRQKLLTHVHPTKAVCETAAAYFRITPKQAKEAIKSMILFNNLLIAPQKWKRKLISISMKAAGRGELTGLMIPFEKDERLADTDEELPVLCERAIPTAVQLIENYDEFLRGEAALDGYLNRNYK